VISSLGAGGAERVMSNMANYWAGKGWTVTLITLGGKNADFYHLDEQVFRVALGVASRSRGAIDAIVNNFRRILALHKAINCCQADAVISFMDRTNVLTMLAIGFCRTPIIVCERTDPRQFGIGKIWDSLRNLLYPKAAALVVQTPDVLQWAVDRVGEKKAFVIPNFVNIKVDQPSRDITVLPQHFILGVGRIGIEKGFDLLMRAFINICGNHPEWSLVILGEGSERLSLEAMAKEQGIENRIFLPGLHHNPIEVMAKASIFVLPSRYEGFPNALIEAMACGLPVISFDCPSGPREIIRHGIDGILVPPEDVTALADSMNDLIAHPEKRERLASRAIEIIDRFGENRIMSMWEDLVFRVARK